MVDAFVYRLLPFVFAFGGLHQSFDVEVWLSKTCFLPYLGEYSNIVLLR